MMLNWSIHEQPYGRRKTMPTKINDIALTADELNALFRYDEATGKLYNRVNRGTHARAGTEAGCTTASGYRQVRLAGVTYRTHRIIWKMNTGEDPVEELDHINHCPLDNRIENLREVSHQKNHMNQSRYKDNISGVTGVSWNKRTQKWRAYINVEGKQVHLGLFTYFFHAVIARNLAELHYDYHPNHGEVA